MTPPIPGWKPAKTKVPVHIPTLAGDGIAETIEVQVSAWKDADGEIYLSGEAEAEIEAVKARHMGLMTPVQLKELRQALDLTQKQIAHLLQLGEKTWTRWESGRERPSRSMNILLNALMDGHVNVTYLRCRHPDFMRQQSAFHPFRQRSLPRRFPTWNLHPSTTPAHESESVPS
ncbi:MAG: helix-turn-helix domain-containing protein [Verrucomicrobiaceae bacterium]|nr:helix-turn-helix domain-containing protein [Verrucomicrobiaceae bacterium]